MSLFGLTSRPGTWNIGGYNIPDYGFTEALNIGTPNPSFSQPQSSQMSSTRSVLPASTVNNPTGGSGKVWQTGEWNGNNQFWNGQWYAGGYKGNQSSNNNVDQSGNTSQSDMAALDASYTPYINELGNIGAGYEAGQIKDLENVGASEATSRTNIGNEEKDLMANLGLQGQRLEQGGQSAYSEAVRAYNALVQQGLSKYGMGSSAGGAIGELVGQEFLRSTGKQRQQLEQGKQDLGLETQKVKTYISDKLGQLDTWFRDKKAEIDANFRANMANLNTNKALAEGEKTRAKLALLQDSIAQTKRMAADDKSFRQSLATFAADQVSKFSGRALTPQEIAGVVNDMMGQTISNFSSQYGGPTTYNPNPTRKKTYDEYGNLIQA